MQILMTDCFSLQSDSSNKVNKFKNLFKDPPFLTSLSKFYNHQIISNKPALFIFSYENKMRIK